MKYNNNTTLKRRELLVLIAKLCFDDTLVEKIDLIPLERYPKKGAASRCCIHKSRATVKQRILAILGFSIEDDDNELLPLNDYAKKALERDKLGGNILTVIDEGCSACVRANYFVTNACQGCLARPCTVNCPKDAITFIDGKAKIEEDKCVNCGRCMKVCPYHAIIFVPVPCEEACPVGAITKDESGKEIIDYDKCIYCGRCVRECPFGAIMERSQIVDVINYLKNINKKVVAMIAPSIVGQFPGSMPQLFNALKKLGFSDVVEVALGADITAENEAEELFERLEKGDTFMTTSCCPAYTQAVKKHIPNLLPKVSNTKTPLHYTAKMVSEKDLEVIKIFIGPCIAKRKEAFEDSDVDFVLTYEELGTLFIATNIDVSACDEVDINMPAKKIGRRFAKNGGVTESIKEIVGKKFDLNPIEIQDLTKKEINLLKSYAKRGAPGNFIEVMSCENGCLGGPGVVSDPRVSARHLKTFIENCSLL